MNGIRGTATLRFAELIMCKIPSKENSMTQQPTMCNSKEELKTIAAKQSAPPTNCWFNTFSAIKTKILKRRIIKIIEKNLIGVITSKKIKSNVLNSTTIRNGQ